MAFSARAVALLSCSATRDSPITSSEASPASSVSPRSFASPREALAGVPTGRTDAAADRDPAPAAVLPRLLMLVDVDAAVGVLVDHRGVIRADELGGMQLHQGVVV